MNDLSSSPQTTSQQGHNPSQSKPKQYLQLCIRAERFSHLLEEVEVDSTKSDGDLFEAIRMSYEQARPSLLPLWLRISQPTSAIYVKVRYTHLQNSIYHIRNFNTCLPIQSFVSASGPSYHAYQAVQKCRQFHPQKKSLVATTPTIPAPSKRRQWIVTPSSTTYTRRHGNTGTSCGGPGFREKSVIAPRSPHLRWSRAGGFRSGRVPTLRSLPLSCSCSLLSAGLLLAYTRGAREIARPASPLARG